MIINSITYCIYFFILVVLSFPKKYKEDEVIIKSFVVFSLLIFFGFRGYIATDYSVYAVKYREAPGIFDAGFCKYFFSNSSSFEKGFTLFMCICKSITNNYFFFQFINFLIDLILFSVFINYFLPRKFCIVAYVCLFCFQGFIIELNLLRNSKAIMLFCVSLIYLDKKKYLYYCLLNILGVLFHVSAIFYFVLPFFIYKPISKKVLLFLFILGNIFFILRINWIIPIAQKIVIFFGQTRLSQLINVYLLLSDDVEKYTFGFGFLERNFTYLLMLHYQPKILSKDPQKIPFINMVYLNNFMYLFCSEVLVLTQRLPPLIACGYWIMIPSIYSYIKDIYKKNVYWVLLLLYVLLKISTWTSTNYMRYSNALFTKQDLEQSTALIKKEYLRSK